MNRLPPLPGSDERTLKANRADTFYEKKPSEIWMGEIKQQEPQETSGTNHKHFLVLQSSREAQCGCGWGIYVGVGDEIKDGHLYNLGRLIV